MKRLEWSDLAGGAADRFDGAAVEISGWMAPPEPGPAPDYFLLAAEPPCCCLPTDPLACVEVFAATGVPLAAQRIALRGTWRVLADDPVGWRYQLRDARPVGAVSRRRVLAAGLLTGLLGGAHAAAARGTGTGESPAPDDVTPKISGPARDLVARTIAVDIHSHAGSLIGVKRVENDEPFSPLAAPMREGGMAVVCLAVVSDSPTHRVMADKRIHPFRDPEPGELYAYGKRSFERLHDLVREDALAVLTHAAAIGNARADAPSIVVAAEGGDFLEGNPDRIDEAYERWGLRHLQLTHYRVNELGDIQTEAPVHGGLTDAGAEAIRRCNARGLVVDVAHATFDMVRRAATVTTRPLVLSHTSLSQNPGPRSRTISADHAKAIAGTGGVIGVWPPAGIYPDLAAMATGMARLVDVAGIDHVGLGSDMMGLVGPSVFGSYRDLPSLAQALLDQGFNPEEAAKILGGNYRRVFAASLA